MPPSKKSRTQDTLDSEMFDAFSDSEDLNDPKELDDEDLIESIDKTPQKWFELEPLNAFQVATSMAGCESPDDLRTAEVKRRLTEQLIDILNLHLEYTKRKRIYNKFTATERQSCELKIKRLLDLSHCTGLLMTAACEIKRISHPSFDGGLSDELGLFRFQPVDEENTNALQSISLFLLATAYSSGYRKIGDGCYSEIVTEDGYKTRAWRRICTIKEFVLDSTKKETNFTAWCNLMSRSGMLRDVSEYLAVCREPEFPFLNMDRHTFSFKNGVYLAHEDVFINYETERLGNDIVSCNHWDVPFNDYVCKGGNLIDGDWYTIPTPACQQIMDYQKFPEEVCRWTYALL